MCVRFRRELLVVLLTALTNVLFNHSVTGQALGGAYDFAQARNGERRGDWTPGEWIGAILLVMTIVSGLVFSVGLCYYVTKRRSQPTVYSGSSSSVDGRGPLVAHI